MKSKPLVSILINNYNKDLYCVDALNSAINQSYKNIEIIFYDDASTDNSIKKIIELKKKYKNKTIKIIENKERGNIFSRNQMFGIEKSLKKSKGEIICLLDSDDFFKKDKIEKVVNFFVKKQSKDIVYDIPIFYYKKKKIISKNEYFPRKNKWPKFPPTSCVSFRKKDLLKDINKINVRKFNDLWFDFRIASYFAIKKKQFNLLSLNLTYYRQHDQNFDKKYKKFLNSAWWKRRDQAFRYIFFLDKNLYQRNIFSFDFVITKLINKFCIIF